MKASSGIRALAALAAAASIITGISTVTIGQSTAPQSFGKWGVDLTSRDPRIKAGDDFFSYANGSQRTVFECGE